MSETLKSLLVTKIVFTGVIIVITIKFVLSWMLGFNSTVTPHTPFGMLKECTSFTGFQLSLLSV
jgi:hypothetical protein